MDSLLFNPELNFFPQTERLYLLKAEFEFVNLSHAEDHTKMHFLCKHTEAEHEESEWNKFQVF